MPDLTTCLLLAWAVLATVAAIVCAACWSTDHLLWQMAKQEAVASRVSATAWYDRYRVACAIAREARARLDACRAAGHAVGKRMRHFEAWALHHLRRRREQVWALESERNELREDLARCATAIGAEHRDPVYNGALVVSVEAEAARLRAQLADRLRAYIAGDYPGPKRVDGEYGYWECEHRRAANRDCYQCNVEEIERIARLAQAILDGEPSA